VGWFYRRCVQQASPVPYRPAEAPERSGLELSAGELRAWRDGELVAQAQVGEDLELAQLLDGYRAVSLLPGCEFSLDGSRRELDVTISLLYNEMRRVTGAVESGGMRGWWEAMRLGDNAFLLQERLPRNARPWARDEERGYGWEIGLPGFLYETDRVLRQRAGLAIEAFLYALKSGREISVPYRRRITNVFSASEPTWDEPLPLVREVVP